MRRRDDIEKICFISILFFAHCKCKVAEGVFRNAVPNTYCITWVQKRKTYTIKHLFDLAVSVNLISQFVLTRLAVQIVLEKLTVPMISYEEVK